MDILQIGLVSAMLLCSLVAGFVFNDSRLGATGEVASEEGTLVDVKKLDEPIAERPRSPSKSRAHRRNA